MWWDVSDRDIGYLCVVMLPLEDTMCGPPRNITFDSDTPLSRPVDAAGILRFVINSHPSALFHAATQLTYALDPNEDLASPLANVAQVGLCAKSYLEWGKAIQDLGGCPVFQPNDMTGCFAPQVLWETTSMQQGTDLLENHMI